MKKLLTINKKRRSLILSLVLRLEASRIAHSVKNEQRQKPTPYDIYTKTLHNKNLLGEFVCISTYNMASIVTMF